MKKMIATLLALMLALCCLALPVLAEDWSDYYSFSDESAIGYDAALEAYQAYPAVPEGTRIELLPCAAVLTGDATLAANVEGAAEALVLGDGESTVTWTVEVPKIDETIFGGHGGGDDGIIRELYEYLSDSYDGFRAADIDASVENHFIAFAAEQSRREGTVVNVEEMLRQYNM